MSATQETQASEETQPAREVQDAPGAPDSSEPEVSPPLTELIAAIRTAVGRGASVEARALGASACRSLLTVLEAKPGQPLAAPPQPAVATASAASPLMSLLAQPGILSRLAAMSRDELFGLLKQVTGALPARASNPTSAGPRFHLIQIPQVRRPGGT